MAYDVEADWILLTTCNFRCSYCFLPVADLGAKIRTYGTPAQWLEGFDSTGKTWLLHISGGEPSIYPDFVGLCERLARHHYLSINTNLSHRSLDDFAERVDPERVHFVNAAVHYDGRIGRAALDTFVDRVLRFEERGFVVLVSFVMTPALIAGFPEVQERFEARGLFVIPKVLRGQYEGNAYPDSYAEPQKALIRGYLARARQQYASASARMGEPPSIDMFSDDRFLDGVESYRGRMCAAGANFVRLEPDGTVVRCGSRKTLGNVLLGDVSLLGAPRRCDTSYCPYFCAKYTASPFVSAPDHPDGSLMSSLSSRVKRALGT